MLNFKEIVLYLQFMKFATYGFVWSIHKVKYLQKYIYIFFLTLGH